MKIHQILPALGYGDAVSNDAIEIRSALRRMGYDSDIFAKFIDPKVADFAKLLSQYKENPNNIVIYHFSLVGSDVTEFVKLLPDVKVLIYHNITPHHYFKGINDELWEMCRSGREELKSLSHVVKLALGDSEYNEKELLLNGFDNTGTLPILLDYSKYNSKPNIKIIEKYDDSYVNLLFVGRISPNKKQEDLIKIFYYYKIINPKSRLFLVGSYRGMEKYYTRLQEMVRRLSLTDVVFTGQVSFEEMIAYYRLADVFLCMSEHEGFCVPLLESMYFKIPIIAYNSTAIPYTLANCGILVNNKRYNEIVEMLDILINDNILREKLIGGQIRRLKDFDIRNVENIFQHYIEQIDNSENQDSFLMSDYSRNVYVSVIICTYNRAKYLEKCLRSLRNQTYINFEIIVVNGPSTDETYKVLERFSEIKLVEQKKLNGLSSARNLGIKESKGDIIMFIDDDAVADENWIKYLVEEYTDKSIGGVDGPVFDTTGKWYQFRNGYISKTGIPSFIHEKDLNYNDPKGDLFNYVMGTNSSFRRSILYKVGLFDEKIKYYIDETDVCVRVIKNGHKIKHVDNAIVFHEMTEGHNRKSRFDINWSEIMKNVIYFTMKNFRDEFSSYTIRPIKSFFWWLENFYHTYRNKDISLKQMLVIDLKLTKGAINGYMSGLKNVVITIIKS